jgi:hypothetical protein
LLDDGFAPIPDLPGLATQGGPLSDPLARLRAEEYHLQPALMAVSTIGALGDESDPHLSSSDERRTRLFALDRLSNEAA